MDLAAMIKALGDPTRFKIFQEIVHQKHCTRALAWKMKISEPGVSQHLKVLREAGLVYRQKYGYHVHYLPSQEALDFLAEQFAEMRALSRAMNRDPLQCDCRSRREAENQIVIETMEKEKEIMRIAVTYEQDGTIFQHFGHTEQFKFYDVKDNAVEKSQIVSAEGFGHGALAGFLLRQQVDCLICGGIGAGAQNALAEAGIKLFAGCEGSADEAVEKLLAGTLNYETNPECTHHGQHHHDGDCGHNHCAEHHCQGN